MERTTVKPAKWLARQYDLAMYRKDKAEEVGTYGSPNEIGNAISIVKDVQESLQWVLNQVKVGEYLEAVK